MRLPVIHVSDTHSPDDLVRLYHRTQLHWRRHLGEEAMLESGTAIVNPALAEVPEANCMIDAAVPPEMNAEQAAREVNAHFEQQQSRCAEWVLNPSLSQQHAQPLITHLLASGHALRTREILHARGQSAARIEEAPGLTIIPARASYRHARQLAEEMTGSNGASMQMAEAAMLHLDDPHVDALLALRDGTAVASVSVLAVGDMGCIENLFVSERSRGHGIARTMMSRAMEICARSLFKHVFISADDAHADRTLLSQLGFARVGTYCALLRRPPDESPAPA